jgi:hypothetical protein
LSPMGSLINIKLFKGIINMLYIKRISPFLNCCHFGSPLSLGESPELQT